MFTKSIIDLHVVTNVWPTSCRVKTCGMQYNGQTNDKFRYMWNNYKHNNRKSLSGEDHEQAGSFAHFQTDGNSGFINDTESSCIDKTDPSDPTRPDEFWIDTLATRYPKGLSNIDPYH